MSLSELWNAGDSLSASIPHLTGSFGPASYDSFFVFLICILALLALGESIPHRNPCPGCWESDKQGCQEVCSAYRAWKRRSDGNA